MPPSNYTTTPLTTRTNTTLSISTSTPSPSSTTSSKSPYTPQRTSSSPFPASPSPSPASATQRRATEPRSAGGMRSPGMRLEEAKRRFSNEGKINVHTECGRHGDEWLFGGFSVAGAVRKMLGEGKKGGE